MKRFLPRSGLRKKRTESEDFLLNKVKSGDVPKHIAIIMDGNGRWAAKRGLPRLAGHRAGVTAIREIIEIAPRVGVEYLTLYTFSVENWRRPKDEVTGLMSLFEEILRKEIDELHKNGVRLGVIGRYNELPESTRRQFDLGIEKTAGNDGLKLLIALNYSGRAEIVDAVKKIIDDRSAADSVNEEAIAANLYTAGIPDPDLVIRTSGEMRISNLLLWQIAYSEIWVTDILWPDFRKIDFLEAIDDFQKRKRRFGGAGQSGPAEKGI